MDTPNEIARDEYIQEHLGCCATCHYWQKDGSCMNFESPFAADWMEPEDGCDKHILKRNIHF